MEKNRFHETGPVFRYGDTVTTSGQSAHEVVNKVIAEHQRLLASPLKEAAKRTGAAYADRDFCGRRETVLPDGTKVITIVNTAGLVPTLISRVESPEFELIEEVAVQLDSGFVFPDTTEGYLWLNGEVEELYENYKDVSLLRVFGTTTDIGGGNVPRSFSGEIPATYAVKLAAVTNQAPGLYTGKLKWLVAGQAGLWLTSEFWADHDTFTRAQAQEPRKTGEGIFTDENGCYWYIELSYSGGLSGTATLLETRTDLYDCPAAYDFAALGNDIQRQIETHILATAKKTATVWTINIAGDALTGTNPLANGWHFNRTGAELAIVLHTFTATYQNELASIFTLAVDTNKYTAALIKDADAEDFTLTVSLEQNYTWALPIKATLWVPVWDVGSSSYKMTSRYATNQLDFSSFSIPLYCFYDKENVLQDCLLSYEHTLLPGDVLDCQFNLNGVTMTASDTKPEQTQVDITLSVSEESITVQELSAITGNWDYNLSYSTQNTTEVISYQCHAAISRTNFGYINGCALPENVVNWSFETAQFGTGCVVTETKNYELVDYSLTWVAHTNDGSFAGVAIVAPVGEASSLCFIAAKNEGGVRKQYSRVPDPEDEELTYIWKAQVIIDCQQCPGYDGWVCSPQGTFDSGLMVRNFAFPGDTTLVSDTAEYRITTRRGVFTPHGLYEATPYVEDTDFILNIGRWDSWFWLYSDHPPGVISPVVVSHGGTQACRMFDGFDVQLFGGYPEETATLVIGWA